MNYHSLLDGFFGNNWICYGLLLVYMVLIFVFHRRIAGPKEKRRKVLLGFLYFAMPLLWLLTIGLVNPTWWGFGKPRGITALYVADGKLYVQDFLMTAGGKTSRGSPYSRIHVVDPATGEGLLRFSVGAGKGDIIGVHGDTLAYATADEVQFFSVSTGELLYAWNAETLPQLFPELSPGLNQFSAYKTGNALRVNSMDGNYWVLDILDNTISPDGNSITERTPSGKMFVKDGAIYVDNRQDYPEQIIHLDYKNGSGQQEVLEGVGDSILNPSLTFLDGRIIALDLQRNCFVVMHYTTTARTQVIFTAVSLENYQQLWSIPQTQLRPEDAENEEQVEVPFATDEKNGALIVCFKTEVICLDLKDGAVKWRKIP